MSRYSNDEVYTPWSMPLEYRKHHVPSTGDIVFCNGYGLRWDCCECVAGTCRDGSICKICGPKFVK